MIDAADPLAPIMASIAADEEDGRGAQGAVRAIQGYARSADLPEDILDAYLYECIAVSAEYMLRRHGIISTTSTLRYMIDMIMTAAHNNSRWELEGIDDLMPPKPAEVKDRTDDGSSIH